MGIRIHKNLGYGVTSTERIYMSKFRDLHHEAYDMKYEQFLTFVEENREDILEFYNRIGDAKPFNWKGHFDFTLGCLKNDVIKPENAWKTIGGLVTHDNEYGLPDVIVFRPMQCESWARYDNIIDYCETDQGRHEDRNNVKLVTSAGIYPWLGYVRMRPAPPGIWKTPEAEEKAADLVPSDYSRLVGQWSPDQPPLASGELLEHLLNDYRPVLPLDIHMLLWYFKDGFSDLDDFTNQLRPMIYTYWG